MGLMLLSRSVYFASSKYEILVWYLEAIFGFLSVTLVFQNQLFRRFLAARFRALALGRFFVESNSPLKSRGMSFAQLAYRSPEGCFAVNLPDSP